MTSEPGVARLFLYHTEACHLCELAEQLLLPLVASTGLVVELRDISEDDDLLMRYGARIPVLRDPLSGRELDWPFDAGQVHELVG